jgi:hypothetical protein
MTQSGGNRHRPRSRLTTATLGGLAVGVLGLLLQFIADPAKFGVFPPGIYFVVVAAAILWLHERWRWSPLIAVALGLWIVIGGTLSGDLPANLASSDILTVAGNIVMVLGPLGAAGFGIGSVVRPGHRTSGQRQAEGMR